MLWLFIVNHPVKYIFRFHTPEKAHLTLSMLPPSNLRPSKAQQKSSRAGNKFSNRRSECFHAAECIFTLYNIWSCSPPLKITIISLTRALAGCAVLVKRVSGGGEAIPRVVTSPYTFDGPLACHVYVWVCVDIAFPCRLLLCVWCECVW